MILIIMVFWAWVCTANVIYFIAKRLINPLWRKRFGLATKLEMIFESASLTLLETFTSSA